MNLKIFTDNVEPAALNQIYTLAKLPVFSECKIRIMPDVHAGAGCVIGFTADLGDKVIPNIVGVDIGCGMRIVDLGNINIDYDQLDWSIRKNIPSGRNVYDQSYMTTPLMKVRMSEVFDKRPYCFNSLKNIPWITSSMGTLGGGNHFIEIDESDDGRKYLVIHTGSRNLGKQVADYWQNVAISNIIGNKAIKEQIKNLIKEYKSAGRQSEIESAIKQIKPAEHIPRDLCYLVGEDREKYLHDMAICQDFAVMNRDTIAYYICWLMGWDQIDSWESVHNYVDLKTNMIRKGAISAQAGERVIIPINMRDGCIIGEGKGNEDWNCSAPHGAGRILSRSAAKETITMDEYKESMKGIYTTSVCSATIDESPMAYKPIQEIVDNIQGTVDIKQIIKPVYNFKAAES